MLTSTLTKGCRRKGAKDSVQPRPFGQTTCKSLSPLFGRWVADTVALHCRCGRRALQHLMGEIRIRGTQAPSLAKDGPSQPANGACRGRQPLNDCGRGPLPYFCKAHCRGFAGTDVQDVDFASNTNQVFFTQHCCDCIKTPLLSM